MQPFLREMLAATAAATLGVGTALADPADLTDSRPRWIQVQLESSPADRPGQLSTRWTRVAPAWLQPTGHPGWVVVAISGEAVERLLAGQDPKPGSFGDFVWLFDARTGHVIAAELEGTLYRRVGPLRSRVEVQFRAEMSTERPLGFRAERRLLGQRIYDPCDPGAAECNVVEPTLYDSDSGYVNAVGVIRARSVGHETLTFATLGEARFFELDTLPVVATSGEE